MSPRELKLRAKLAWLNELERRMPSPSEGGPAPLDAQPLASALVHALTARPAGEPTALPQERQDEASAASVAPKLLHVAPSSA